MKVVFASNYFNHHQRPFCEELYRRLGGSFAFVGLKEMREERKKLGYGEAELPAYVHNAYLDAASAEDCNTLLSQADVLLAGQVPQSVIDGALARGAVVFRYSERPLKRGRELHKYLPRLIVWRRRNPKNKAIYLLCAGAYTALDYARFGLFRGRALRWGYFPEVKRYESFSYILEKKDTARLLWVGRLLDWKHPEDAITVAMALKKRGIKFRLDMIGIGPMEESLRQLITRNGLGEQVQLLGAIRPAQVREHMEKAGIFLFTSDFQEGWGAVLNEAMNSGCAVVASHSIGAAPYLISDGENGLLYSCGNIEMLSEKTESLLQHPGLQRKLGQNAYNTMLQGWNGELAAQRFIQLAQWAIKGEDPSDCFDQGVGSPAEIIRENWYQ